MSIFMLIYLMNKKMNTLKETEKIIRENKLIAKKRFGQNFLIDDEILKTIVDKSELINDDVIIEIGPGLGNLTSYILEKGVKVYAFEIDYEMIKILKKRFENNKNLIVINQDILKVNLKEYIKDRKVKIIANLPYYITTPIIFKLLEKREYIESITVMVQKEVAERIVSSPNKKNFGALTIGINAFCDTKKIVDVPKTSFIPVPKVDSSVVIIVPNNEKQRKIKNESVFKDVVKKAFSQRRKTLLNALSNSYFYKMTKEEIESMLISFNVSTNKRAEQIEISKYIEISNYMYEKLNKNKKTLAKKI